MTAIPLAIFCDEHAVEVGQVLNGHVTWHDAPAKTRNIVVSLRIRVEGEGDGFQHIVSNVTLSVPTRPAAGRTHQKHASDH